MSTIIYDMLDYKKNRYSIMDNIKIDSYPSSKDYLTLSCMDIFFDSSDSIT